MRIGFLLGSGVSLPAGMASTPELTQAVLRVEDYTLHTDESFVVAGSHLGTYAWAETQPLLISLLQMLNRHCQNYFDAEKGSRRTVNYEDLFFAASQLQEHLSEEYENPAIEPFAQQVLTELPQLHDRARMNELTDMICNYIRDVIAIKLSKEPTSVGHLTCLVDAVRDPDFGGCDIFTLNHDLLVERVLVEAGLSFVDGFGSRDGDVARWEPNAFREPSRNYFLKLHGSINWMQYRRKQRYGHLFKVFGPDPYHARTGDGKYAGTPDRVRVLVGTFNKIRDYFGSPYFDLLATFRRQMEDLRWLIVSGYSFGDKGVNAVLSEWMRAGTQSRLLVLHAHGDECIANARGAIRSLWARHKGKRMFIHPHYLGECKWWNLRNQIE